MPQASLASPQQPPPTPKRASGYLPSLDGWRAIAILGVLMTHDVVWHLGPFSNAGWKGWGGDGVYLFFAISGLLICWRILEEESIVGSFDLKSFYIRRLFRIQPAAVVYLSVILTLMLTHAIVHETWRAWFGALFLYQNFLYHASDPQLLASGSFLGHFWTLAVEEHFYILLSLLLFSVRRYRIPVFAALLCGLSAAHSYARAHGAFSVEVSPRRTWWLVQFLLFPAWVALLTRVPVVLAICRRWLHPWAAFSVTLLYLLARESRDAGHLILQPFNLHLLALEHTIFFLFPVWIVATMLHPASASTRLLEWSPLRLVGRLSYSLYLWHVLFFHLDGPQTANTWLRSLGTRPWNYLLVALFTCASYYLLEKPCMRLGHRLAPPATPGRLDLIGLPVEPTDAQLQAIAH